MKEKKSKKKRRKGMGEERKKERKRKRGEVVTVRDGGRGGDLRDREKQS